MFQIPCIALYIFLLSMLFLFVLIILVEFLQLVKIVNCLVTIQPDQTMKLQKFNRIIFRSSTFPFSSALRDVPTSTWWAESAPSPGWDRVKTSENLGATAVDRPCGYIPGPTDIVLQLLICKPNLITQTIFYFSTILG